MKSALFFLGIVALAAATPIPFTNCGTSTDLLRVDSIDVSPNPPKKGDTVAVSFEGELSAGFSAASWAASVKWSIFTKNYNGDVCAELQKAGHPCPLNAGPQTIVASLDTGSAPTGTFSVQATAKTSDGKQIMCTQFKFQINSANEIVASTDASATELTLGAGGHPLECAACQFTIAKLQELLENSTSLDQKVADFLQNDFCTLLPKDAQLLCNTTVVAETPAILAGIAQKLLNASIDCTKLGLCPAARAPQLRATGELCKVCEKVVEWIDNEWFNNTQAQDFLVQEIETICNFMPKSIQVPCDAAANQTAPALMQKIGDYLATEGCEDIHLCQ